MVTRSHRNKGEVCGGPAAYAEAVQSWELSVIHLTPSYPQHSASEAAQQAARLTHVMLQQVQAAA